MNIIEGVIKQPMNKYFIRAGGENIEVTKKTYDEMFHLLGLDQSWVYDKESGECYEINHQMDLFDSLSTDEPKSTKITKKPRFHIQLLDTIHGYYNLHRDSGEESLDTRLESDIYQTMFTKDEIKAINPKYLDFIQPIRK